VNVLVMGACTCVHDELSCIRLQNYMIMYTNIVAEKKFIVKNNFKKTSSASKTT